MKDMNYYSSNGVPHPKKGDYQTVYYYHKGEVMLCLKPGEEKPLSIDPNWVKEIVFDKEGYLKADAVYNEVTRQKHEEFKQDLFEDLGIQDNPKKEKLFDKAWDRGHSHGYSEVYGVASDLVELIE